MKIDSSGNKRLVKSFGKFADIKAEHEYWIGKLK